jgi:uncharacterized protein (TIGR03083 family)
MRSRVETIDNLTSCYDDIEQLMAGFATADWDVQSLCPDWTVRGVVAHLAAIEHILDGWLPTGDDIKPAFDRVGPFLAETGGWSNEQLAAETRRTLDSRRAQLAAVTDDELALSSMTPVGEATYGRFMEIRAFDFWVHQRDMAIPLGRPTDDSGSTAELALDEVHSSIGYIVGKKVGLPDGMSIAFHLSGPVERDLYAVVEGRAAKVDHVDDPSVEVTTDFMTFMLLACGRIDPQEPIDRGEISWAGDPTWGEHAARNLRFTF